MDQEAPHGPQLLARLLGVRVAQALLAGVLPQLPHVVHRVGGQAAEHLGGRGQGAVFGLLDVVCTVMGTVVYRYHGDTTSNSPNTSALIPPPGVLPGAGQDAAFGQLEVLYGRRGNGLPGAVLAASEAAVHGDCKFDFGVTY